MTEEIKNRNNLTDGQEIVTEFIGEVAGVGGGGLIGGLAMAVALSIETNKIIKLVYCIGSVGIAWALRKPIASGTKEAVGDLIGGFNGIKSLFSKDKKQPVPVESNANVIK